MFGIGGKKPRKVVRKTRVSHGLRFSYDDVDWVVEYHDPMLLFGSSSQRMLSKLTNAISPSGRRIIIDAGRKQADQAKLLSATAVNATKKQVNDSLLELLKTPYDTESGHSGNPLVIIDGLTETMDMIEDPTMSDTDAMRTLNTVRNIDDSLDQKLEGDDTTKALAMVLALIENDRLPMDEFMRTYPESVVELALIALSRENGESIFSYVARMRGLDTIRKTLMALLESDLPVYAVSDIERKPALDMLKNTSDDGHAPETDALLAALRSARNAGYDLIIIVESYDERVIPFMSIVKARVLAGLPGDDGWLMGMDLAKTRNMTEDSVIVSSKAYNSMMKVTHDIEASPIMGMDRLSVIMV